MNVDPIPAELPRIIMDGLEMLERTRQKVLQQVDRATMVCSIIALCPEAKAEAQIDWFGDLAVSCAPATLADVSNLLRHLRTSLNHRCEPTLHPDGSYINYRIGLLCVTVHLNRQCRFKQTGTRTVEQPVYAIECEGDAMPTLQEAADVCPF